MFGQAGDRIYKSEQCWAFLLWTIAGFLLLVTLVWSLNKGFDHDELEVIHTSWKIYKGEEIYVDFFQHHHPLLYYLLIPVIALLGAQTSVLIVARLIIYALYVGILGVTYLIARRIFNGITAIASLILLISALMYTRNAIEIRPDVPQTLFCLLSVYFLLLFLEKNRLKDLLASALSVGVAFVFLQKALFFLILNSVIIFFSQVKPIHRLGQVAIYSSLALLPFAIYALQLLLNNDWSDYFKLNWLLNFRFLDRGYPWQTLLGSYQENTLLWVFFVVTLVFFLRSSNQKRLGFITLGLLLLVIYTKKSHQQYFIPLIPLISILSAQSFYRLFDQQKRIFAAVLVLAILFPSLNLLQGSFEINNRDQLAKINYVLEFTDQDDYVYDGDIFFNVFRKDINFFWYSLDQGDGLDTYQSFNQYSYDIYQSIAKYQPRVISNYYLDTNHPQIKEFYTRSPAYPDLYIRRDSP